MVSDDAIEPENDNDEVGVTNYELYRQQTIKENLERMQKLGIIELSHNLKPPPKPKIIRPYKPLTLLLTPQRRSSRIQTIAAVDSREQRIKENLERMQKLGIIELSRNLKPPPKPKTIRPQKPLPLSLTSQRRSSRIPTMPTVNYSQKRVPKSKEKVIKDVRIEIYEGSQPEVYTEEHEKVLGDHKEPWTLFVDGYDNEGNRIYDGKRCHQCRKRTPGHYTQCCKCNKKAKGQFCGDCLFKREYFRSKGEPRLVCPVCRDICNCPRCRNAKGWWGTKDIYAKVLRLGFKSVAHYLIHTRGPKGKLDDVHNKTQYEEDYKSNGLNDDDDDNDNDNANDDEKDGSSGEDD